MNLSEITRSDFSFLDSVTYLDSASVGLSWEGHAKAAADFYRGPKSMGYNGDALWTEFAGRVKRRLAGILKVREDEIFFLSNTTEAVNLIVHSMRCQPGDEFVVASDEYPSVILPWFFTEEKGGKVIKVDITEESERENCLIKAITSKTKVMAVSQVHFSTGTQVSLARLGALCHEAGILLLIDGTQAFGAVPVDLSHVDFYVASMYKWMLGAFGLSVVVAKKDAQSAIIPAYNGYKGRNLQYAHLNYPALWVLDASISYLENLGWETIFDSVHSLTGYLTSEMEGIGLAVKTPKQLRAGIVSFAAPDPVLLVEKLKEKNIYIAERSGLVRVSPHFYNNEGDIDTLIQALTR